MNSIYTKNLKILVYFIFISIFLIGINPVIEAQYTNVHYIAPSPWSYFNRYNELVITTTSTSPVAVTIAGSDSTLYSNSLTTVAGTPLRYRFTALDATANYSGVVLSGQGLIISASVPIGVQIRNIASDYYSVGGQVQNYSNNCVQKGNSAFTSLGDQGQGTSFRVGYYANVSGITCYTGESGAPLYAAMAINNNTNIYVNGSLLTTLNAGQSYIFQTSIGSIVTSSDLIVLNAGMRADNTSGCGDDVQSQIIPINNLGTTYVVVRSNGNSGYERSTIVATKANTTVTVNVPSTNKTTTYTLASPGSYVTINNGDGSTAYSSCYITSNNPVAVYTGSADGCEIDMIVQPPLNNCAGSFDVQTNNFLSNALASNAVFPYFGYVIVQSDTAVVYFNGANLESIVGKRTQIGTTGYYIIKYTNTQLGNPTNLRFVVNARINVALIESGAGYSMSAFISSISNPMPPPTASSNCLPMVFTAQGGFNSYQWYKDSVAITGANAQTYVPSASGLYSVTGTNQNCGTSSISTAVAVNPKPNAGADQIVCNNASITLIGTNPTTNTWIAQANNPSGATLGNTTNGLATVALASTAAGTFNFIYSAGCADTVAVLVKSTSKSITTASICQGNSYTFNGKTYTSSTVDTIHLTNSVGCDSAAILNLTVKPTSTSTTTASICAGSAYTFNGTVYTTAGTYSKKFTNSVGCDSTAILILTVNQNSTSTTIANICTGGSYTFNGTTYTAAGTYLKHLTNSVGCDSAATLILRVNAPSSSTTTASICNGTSYTFNGTAYTTAGTYVAHLTNAAGCDSAATLVLTVKANTSSITNASILSGNTYSFNGNSYTSAGTFTVHLTNSVGCDSAATLVLTVTTISSTSATICSGGTYPFNGSNYSSSGTYAALLTNSKGGDSLATLILTVKPSSSSTTNVSICSGSSYTFNGTTYSVAGSYTAHLTNSVGCDSAATLVLSIKQNTSSITNASICSGTSYSFNGSNYSSAGSYTTHLTNSVGCDSSASLILTVKPLSTSTTVASICAGGSYLFNGTSYAAAGTYTVHLTNSVGCDSSATLVLSVKSPTASTTTVNICTGGAYIFNGTNYSIAGMYVAHLTNAAGCDSAATLILKVNAPSTSITTATICNGGSYSFNGTSYTSAGTYVAHLTNASGCDSAATLILTVKATSSSITNKTIALGSSYQFNGNTYSNAGTYTVHLTNSLGCDSAATLVLTVVSYSTTTASICNGSSYMFNGTAYSTSGTYTTTLKSSLGIDSVATLVLTVKALSTSITTASICYGASYTFNGTTYTSAGTYTAHLTNYLGCDSAATLILSIKSTSTSTTTASICSGSSYTFNGVNYNTAGIYTAHLTNAVGCDSAATLILSVKPLSSNITNVAICNGDSYIFNGTSYSTAGTYTAHLTNSVGCDSAATLILKVNQPSSSTTTVNICSGGSYTFNGVTYTSAGTYIAHLSNSVGCDSAATLILKVNSSTSSITTASICSGSSYFFNGSYYTSSSTFVVHLTNAVGCDSAANLVLTVKSKSTSTTYATIALGSSYTFNGTAYSTVGSYTAHLTNSVGCDSAATLVLTVISYSSTTATICSGSSYLFNGTTYTTPGTYTANLKSVSGIDSVATLILTVKPTSTSTTTASICNGSNYIFNGTSYTTAGTYTVHLANSVGCDSAATLVLSVKANSSSTTTASICNGNSYTFNGNTYSNAGTYTVHLTNKVGCDSAANLVLTVKATSSSTTTASICSGNSYSFNGTSYTTSGTYTARLTNSVGCDSIATLVLTVKPTSSTTTTANICSGSSYTFNGTSYTSTGTYTVRFTNSVGCDSLAILNLTVNANPTVSAITGLAATCVGTSITYSSTTSGGVWTSSNTNVATVNSSTGLINPVGSGVAVITYTVTNASGCVTSVTKSLTVNPVPSVAAIAGASSTCVGSTTLLSDASYGGTWTSSNTNVATIASDGTVTGISSGTTTISYRLATSTCSTTVTKSFTTAAATSSTTTASICNGATYTFNGNSYTAAGTYLVHLTNSGGCDSAATLILTVKPTSTSTTNATICAGNSYIFNGTSYTAAGTYTANLTNSVGCDSIATLVLTVNATSSSVKTASICQGGSYTYNGFVYTTTGTYTTHYTNSKGCDSTSTLILTVNSATASTTSASICSGASYLFNGISYTTTGTYTANLKNSVGCDSLATLILTVKPTSTSSTVVEDEG